MSDRLLFTVPICNARLEILTKLKRVKINFRCSLGVKRLENILRIMEKRVAVGKRLIQCQPAMKKWSTDKVRRTTEETGSRSCMSGTSHPEVNVKSLIDGDDEGENISENGNEEEYFSSDSE